MLDSLLSLVAHPLPVAAHVVGQTLRAAPRLRDDRRLAPRFRVHRRPPGELRRDLDHRLVDQHRYRIQVTGMGFETEPLRFERQAAGAGEGVVERSVRQSSSLSTISMGDFVFLSTMAKVKVKSSRRASSHSSVGPTSIPRARMSCTTALRASSLRRTSA